MQGPALAAFRGGTRFRAQARLSHPTGCVPGRGRSSGPQPLVDEALAEAFDRGTPHSEGGSEGAILPALSRFEGIRARVTLRVACVPLLRPMFRLLAFIVTERHERFS